MKTAKNINIVISGGTTVIKKQVQSFLLNCSLPINEAALAWAHKVGEWQHKVIKPLVLKKHGRLEKSFFRYGLDYLTDCLLHHQADVVRSLRLLLLFLLTPDEVNKHNKIS